ncbi:MAG: serine hydrolase [Fimbriimonas ginsengisoli]|nr:serine hydrolase [Fimbriimonas ginsengisoli]
MDERLPQPQTGGVRREGDEQSKGFSGEVLPKGFKLWSKAGWTSTVYHDVAWIQAPDGREFVWAIFTKGHSDDKIVPFVAGELLKL